jgi:hypothetical protein
VNSAKVEQGEENYSWLLFYPMDGKEKKLTTYVLSHTHKGVDCPGKDPELMKELAAKFSKDNLAKKNVNILDVFVDQSCMLQQTSKDHMCLFVVESESASDLPQLFSPMQIDVRPMIRWRNFPQK